MNLEDIVYWTYQAWEEIEQKKIAPSRRRLQEKKNKLKIKGQRKQWRKIAKTFLFC